MVSNFFNKNLDVTARFSGLQGTLCLTAPPDAENLRQKGFWGKVGLGLYAVLKATNALRHESEEVARLPVHIRAERCLRAGLAEAVRNSAAVKLLPERDISASSRNNKRPRPEAESSTEQRNKQRRDRPTAAPPDPAQPSDTHPM